MLEKRKVEHVWNVELSKTALTKSRELYEKRQLTDNASFFYSDGLKNLSISEVGDREVIFILAGYGAKTSLEILKQLNSDWMSKKLWVVSLSHTNPLSIFKWIRENNWNLIRENYFRYREKIYPILLFSNCSKLDKKNLEYDELFLEYWRNWFQKISKLHDTDLNIESRKLMETYIAIKHKKLS